jgi:acetoin utilization protein AcuB
MGFGIRGPLSDNRLEAMKRIPSIKSVMTPFPHSIGKDAGLDEARAMMAKHRIRHLPVMDGERLTSVIDQRAIDLSRDAKQVREVALREAYVVELTEPLDVVLLHMAKEHLDCAVVVKEGRLAGIFTFSDVCRSYGKLLREIYPRGGGDEAA